MGKAGELALAVLGDSGDASDTGVFCCWQAVSKGSNRRVAHSFGIGLYRVLVFISAFTILTLRCAAPHDSPAFGTSRDATPTNLFMRQALEFDPERRLPLAIADLGAQIGDLSKRRIGGVIVRCLKLRAIESIEIVDAHDSSYALS